MSLLLRNILTKISVPLKYANTSYTNRITTNLCNTITKKAFYSTDPVPYEIVDDKVDIEVKKGIISNVNTQISEGKQGRLFAIVHVAGKQFKITEGDIIVIEGYWPPNAGDKIKLDKVLLLGAKDFTLIGRPLVEAGLVNVYGTVIEKTLSHTKTNFKKKRRKQYTNINFYRIPQTMLRINTIEVSGKVNSPPEVTGLEHKIL